MTRWSHQAPPNGCCDFVYESWTEFDRGLQILRHPEPRTDDLCGCGRNYDSMEHFVIIDHRDGGKEYRRFTLAGAKMRAEALRSARKEGL